MWNFLKLFAYFFCLHFFLLHLLVLQWSLWFPSQVCTLLFRHKDVTLALYSWTRFDCKCRMFHVHHHSSQPSLVLSLDDWLFVLWSRFMIFRYSILDIYIYDYNNQSSAIICCHLFGDPQTSLLVSLLVVSMVHIFPWVICSDPHK